MKEKSKLPLMRWGIVFGLTILYSFVSSFLLPIFGPTVISFSGIPVAAAGWYFGLAGGIIVSLIAVILNNFLMFIFWGIPWYTVDRGGFFMSAAILLMIGAGFGEIKKYSDMRIHTETQLRSRERYLSLLKMANDSILNPHYSSDRYYYLITHLVNLFVADRGYFFRWDAAQEQAILVASTLPFDQPPSEIIIKPAESAIIESVLQTKRTLVIDNVSNSQDIFNSTLFKNLAFPVHSILGIPFIAGEHKLGLVILAFNSPQRFTAEELDYAEQSRQQIALALWTIQQDFELKKRLKEQETLAQITTTLSQIERIGLSSVLDLIVLSARELIPGAQQAVIHLMDKEQVFLSAEAVSGYEQFDRAAGKMRVGEGIAGLVIAEGNSIYIPFIDEDERFIHLNPNAKYHSLLVSPIASDSHMLGTISIQSEKPYAFSKNEITLLSELGQQAAIAIENARLYDAVQLELMERRQAEVALRSSEERYRSVSEDMPAMISRFLPDGTLTFVNAYYCTFYGKTEHELKKFNLLDLIIEENKEKVKSTFLSLNQNKPSISYEIMEINSKGEERWMRWMDRVVLFNEDGTPAEYQTIGIDITDRKLAELEREQLLNAEREQRLRAETSANATLALVSHSETDKVLDEILNQVLKLIPGCAANIALLENGILRTTAWRGYKNRGNEVFLTLFKQPHDFAIDKMVLQDPRPYLINDTQEDPNWKVVPGFEWVRSHLLIPLIWNNEILGLLYIDEDAPNKFTEETANRLKPLVNATTVALESAILIETTRQALRETSALYHINQGLVALDANELLYDAVELLRNNFNYYHVQVFVVNNLTGDFILKAASGETVKKLIESKHEIRAGSGIVGYAAETGLPFFTNNVDEVVFFVYDSYLPHTKAEMAIPIRNGDKLYGILDIQQTASKPFTQRDQQLVITVADQIAVALHKAELYENLESALQQEKTIRNQLIQNERLAVMGRLLASVSHELNNPLQAIQNALFLLKEEKGMSQQGLNDLEIVIAESERMAGLIEHLRDTYRLPQAEDLQPTPVNAIIENVYALIATHLRKNSVAFEFHPEAELPTIMALPDQIRQVVLNLLMNAVEAMQDGGKLTASTHYLRDTNEIMMSVSDTGVGISPAILPYIFDPFVTNKKRGTGMGLTISRDIVINHGGRLTAENNLDGPGAIFKVWLPMDTIPVEIE